MSKDVRDIGNVGDLIRDRRPASPVYCIYPQAYLDAAAEFVGSFRGRVLYAVKANDHPAIVRLLYDGGVRHFDCASVPEVVTVRETCPDAKCYFMIPARLRGAARVAQRELGVRHFMVDHLSGIPQLQDEIDPARAVVFARMAVHHPAAMMELSSKFGAAPENVPALLKAIADTGAEPALAFNVGSAVTSPDAYRHAIEIAARTLAALPFKVRLVDIGGGFPREYPGFPVPPVSDYFQTIEESSAALPLADGAELMIEPGRALAAPGLSAVVEVLLRRENRLYLNDGMYGIFWELRFKGHERFPVRSFRRGERLEGEEQSFKLYGPTCDASDVMPGEVTLPADIQPGDHLEFGTIGAYSLSGRTRFNGHYSDDVVRVCDPDASPPR